MGHNITILHGSHLVRLSAYLVSQGAVGACKTHHPGNRAYKVHSEMQILITRPVINTRKLSSSIKDYPVDDGSRCSNDHDGAYNKIKQGIDRNTSHLTSRSHLHTHAPGV